MPSPKAKALYDSAAFLDASLLSDEPRLINLKWKPYRHLTPLQCNVAFARAYQEAFKDHVRGHVDFRLAKVVNGVSLQKLTAPGLRDERRDRNGEVKALHIARQYADETGLPYYSYIKLCMDFASDRSVRNIPRPNQLIPRDPDGVKDPAERKKLEPIRKAFGERLAKEIDGRLPLHLARHKSNNPDEKLSPIPGCIGHPAARHGVDLSHPRMAEDCKTCPYFEKCGKIADAMAEEIHKNEVAGDPTWGIQYHAATLKERERVRRSVRDSRARKVIP